jgi:hypothetical protein
MRFLPKEQPKRTIFGVDRDLAKILIMGFGLGALIVLMLVKPFVTPAKEVKNPPVFGPNAVKKALPQWPEKMMEAPLAEMLEYAVDYEDWTQDLPYIRLIGEASMKTAEEIKPTGELSSVLGAMRDSPEKHRGEIVSVEAVPVWRRTDALVPNPSVEAQVSRFLMVDKKSGAMFLLHSIAAPEDINLRQDVLCGNAYFLKIQAYMNRVGGKKALPLFIAKGIAKASQGLQAPLPEPDPADMPPEEVKKADNVPLPVPGQATIFDGDLDSVIDRVPTSQDKAYNRLVREISGLTLDQLNSKVNESIKYGHLIKDPAKYRGQLVRVEGTVVAATTHGIDKVPAATGDGSSEINTIYQVIIANYATDQVYIVHLIEKPQPIDWREDFIRIDGYFLKLHQYENEKGKEVTAPFVIGRTWQKIEFEKSVGVKGLYILIVVVIGVTGLVIGVAAILSGKRDKVFRQQIKEAFKRKSLEKASAKSAAQQAAQASDKPSEPAGQKPVESGGPPKDQTQPPQEPPKPDEPKTFWD